MLSLVVFFTAGAQAEIDCSKLNKKKCKATEGVCEWVWNQCNDPPACGDFETKPQCLNLAYGDRCKWEKGACIENPTDPCLDYQYCEDCFHDDNADNCVYGKVPMSGCMSAADAPSDNGEEYYTGIDQCPAPAPAEDCDTFSKKRCGTEPNCAYTIDRVGCVAKDCNSLWNKQFCETRAMGFFGFECTWNQFQGVCGPKDCVGLCAAMKRKKFCEEKTVGCKWAKEPVTTPGERRKKKCLDDGQLASDVVVCSDVVPAPVPRRMEDSDFFEELLSL